MSANTTTLECEIIAAVFYADSLENREAINGKVKKAVRGLAGYKSADPINRVVIENIVRRTKAGKSCSNHNVRSDALLDLATVVSMNDLDAAWSGYDLDDQPSIEKIPQAIERNIRRLINGNGALPDEPAEAGGMRERPPREWPDPKPLPGLRPVDPFDVEWMPAGTRYWVEEIAYRMQCPVDFVAMTVLVELSAVIGAKVGIRPKSYDDWTVNANLWGLLIGRPGVMKTPAMKEALSPLRGLEAEAFKQHAEELAEYEAKREFAEMKIKAAKAATAKKLKGAGKVSLKDYRDALTEAADEAGDIDDPPTVRRWIVNDPTTEKLGELLQENPDGLAVIRDEISGWLARMDQAGHENDRSFYLEAWEGSNGYTFDRIGRGTVRIPNMCLAILGTIQPGPLSAYVNQALKDGVGNDGLLQRFQLAVYPDIPKQWENIDKFPDRGLRASARSIIHGLAAKSHPDDFGAFTDEFSKTPYVRFTDDAQDVFNDWRQALELELREMEDSAMEAHKSKYRKLVPALALIIHFGDGLTGEVDLSALERAIKISRYLESHARRIYSLATCGANANAHKLLDKITAGKLPDPFTTRDVYRPGWSGLTKETAPVACATLEDFDYLRSNTVKSGEHGGRPTVIWRISEKIKKLEKGLVGN